MDVLREAAAARDKGSLVPFIGSGMSREVCCGWPEMVRKLEVRAGVDDRDRRCDSLALVRRAARALDVLRLGRAVGTANAIRDVLLVDGPAEPPPQTRALAQMDWPLVLSTNYDDLYPTAVHQKVIDGPRHRKMSPVEFRASVVRVLGRSSSDCHRVLASLTRPAPPTLWALQGYLGGQGLIRTAPGSSETYGQWALDHDAEQMGERHVVPRLEREVVVGHADYRRVALRSEDFRRAFSEVFRGRSLLFLGSGLGEPYLLDLFSQVIELYGPCAHPHYAVGARNSYDVHFLRRQYGIWVHEIDSYGELPSVIAEIGHRTRRVIRVAEFSAPQLQDAETKVSREGDAGRLKLVPGPYPNAVGDRACALLSGGGSGSGNRLRLEGYARDYLLGSGLISRDEASTRSGIKVQPVEGYTFLWQVQPPPGAGPTPPALIVYARVDPDTDRGREIRPIVRARATTSDPSTRDNRGRLWRDVRLMKPCLSEALAFARATGTTEVVSPVLAAGRLRTIPGSYLALEMIRTWTSSPFRHDTDLTIHMYDSRHRH